jgi:hypothetical protein
MPASQPEERHLCLDMLRASWKTSQANDAHSECAILMEVWRSGGLLQTSLAIPEGSKLAIEVDGRSRPATVSHCGQDDYGFLIEIAVSPSDWFPAAYKPAYLARCVPAKSRLYGLRSRQKGPGARNSDSGADGR